MSRNGIIKMYHEIKEYLQIVTASAGMFQEPKSSSMLLNESLFGETIHALKHKNGYVYCKLLTDGYEGWIKFSNLGHLPQPTHKVTNVRSFIYEEKNIKKKIIHYLPFGSQVYVNYHDDQWSSICLSKSHLNKEGFIPRQHIKDINFENKNWVSIAESFTNIPYKWGGRDTLGIDCSSLIQLSLSNFINFPRDTILQEKVNYKKIAFKDINRGCIVFWKGHVGVMINKQKILHANSYHMKVKTELLSDLDQRKDTQLNKIKSIVRIEK